jgi:hypothetical protein
VRPNLRAATTFREADKQIRRFGAGDVAPVHICRGATGGTGVCVSRSTRGVWTSIVGRWVTAA